MNILTKAETLLRVLLIDDSLSDAETVTNILRHTGYSVRVSRVDELSEVEEIIKLHSWELVFFRTTLASISTQSLLSLMAKVGKDIPCIMLVSEQSEEDRQPFYKDGVKDVVCFNNEGHLLFVISRELESLFLRRLNRRHEHALHESEKRARSLLENSQDAIAYAHKGRHIYVNNTYLALFSMDAENAVGTSILDIISPSDHALFKTTYRQFSKQTGPKPQEISVRCVRSDDEVFNVKIELSHVDVENETCTQLIVREQVPTVVKKGLSNDAIAEILDHDVVTGLYNRLRFLDELEKRVALIDEGQEPSELLYIEIDGFRKINELIGLAGCDLVIKGVAELLRKELLEREIIARYSDHVFMIIIASSDGSYVDERAEIYRKIIDDYVSHANGKVIDLQCSIGISRITENLSSSSVVLERAGKACIQAQGSGGNMVVRYQPLSSEHAVIHDSDESAFWVERVREALRDQSLCLHYQPIVNLHGKEQEPYDVLVRIEESNGSVILAKEFIRGLERSDDMLKVDEWVITKAFATLATQRKRQPKLRFFIKLSKQVIHKSDFVPWISHLLEQYKLPGEAIVFEISETSTLDDLGYTHTKRVFAQLKHLGCEFGLGHFGSDLDFSHSLSELGVDYLKINGNFVANMSKDLESQAAVKAIIEMSKKAGVLSIAEFVSDAKSLALLWSLGVDYVMGFYIQAPSGNLDYNFTEDDL